MKVVVVEDDPEIGSSVSAALLANGYEVDLFATGSEASAGLEHRCPDLVLLDVGLPDIDGITLCRWLRDKYRSLPIVLLTARDTEIDTVIGLSVGADDYVTKPFSPRELVARIRAMLRRPRTVVAPAPPAAGLGAELPAPRVFGPLSIDVASRQVFLDGESVALTRTEFDILATLSSRPGVVWSRRQLIEAVWGEPWVGNDHLVDVHIGHLRRKLGDDPAEARFVSTVRGVGYRMGIGQ